MAKAQNKDKALKQKKAAEKKVTEKKIRKKSTAVKRGQPTAAARLVSSSYVKYGWHKPLSGETKATVQNVSSIADSMYMLEIQRDRPISSLSLRNAIFWEHRQLARQCIISTPAIDHLDLFPTDHSSFRDTVLKVCPQEAEEGEEGASEDGGSTAWSLHYVFETIRQREFLLLPVEIDDTWITIIARFRARIPEPGSNWVDREVADLAIIDPIAEGRETRQELLMNRLQGILRLGCIKLDGSATVRNINVAPVQNKWESGLVAYAFAREFLRRIKVLIWRQSHEQCQKETEQMLWADFQEDYNLDAYRQMLMAACAHQCIEKSGYQLRMALEVPSDESNYNPDLLRRPGSENDLGDERWEFFQSPSHTLTLQIPEQYLPPSHSVPSTPTSPASAHGSRSYEEFEVVTPPETPVVAATPAIDASPSDTIAHRTVKVEEAHAVLGSDTPMEDVTAAEVASSSPEAAYLFNGSKNDADANAGIDNTSNNPTQNAAPVAPMGDSMHLSPRIPGLDIINQATSITTAIPTIPSTPASPSLKRKADDDDEDGEGHSQKKIKLEEESLK